MPKFLLQFFLIFLSMVQLVQAQYDPLLANPGFENNATFANWVLTGSGTKTRTATRRRSGAFCGQIATLSSVNYSTLHNSSYGVTIPATGTWYVTVMGYARAAGNTVTVGVDVGTSADPDGPATPGSPTSNVGNTSTLISYTQPATNGQTYHPVLYSRANGNTTINWDDVIIYFSTQPNTDLAAPNAPNNFTLSTSGTNVTFNFTQGADNATNRSGIAGVLILRRVVTPMDRGNVTPLNQTFYSTNTLIGPNTQSSYNVIYNGPPVSTYTDNLGTNNHATYLVYMRDSAFNYTAAGSAARLLVVNGAPANYSIATQNGSGAVDGLFISADDTLVISSGTTITIRAGSNCQIDGGIRADGVLTSGGASRITFRNGSTYQHNRAATGNALVLATWQTGSQCVVTGMQAVAPSAASLGQSFSHFTWNNPLQTATATLPAAFNALGNVRIQRSGNASLAFNAGSTFQFRGNLELSDTVTFSNTGTYRFVAAGITQTLSGTLAANPPMGNLVVATTGGGQLVLARNAAAVTSFVINAGAQLNGGSGGHLLDLSGTANFTNNGNFTAGNGTVRFSSTAVTSQTISNPVTQPFFNLETNRAAGRLVVLNTSSRVTNQLLLNGGLIVTNNNVLQLANTAGTNAPAFGSNAASYVATTLSGGAPATSGGLTWLGINNTTRLYPVGNSFSSYSPANLVLTGPAEDFTVRVAPGVAPGADIDFSAGLVWNVTEASAGGNQVQLNFQWNSSDEGASFIRSTSRILKSNGVSILPFEKGNLGTAAGGNPYTRSSGAWLFTSFSPFSVSSEATLLPARFTYVQVRRQGSTGVLSWQNATETPGTKYEIQRAENGQDFSRIATVQGLATSLGSQSYSYTDTQADAGKTWYYRVVAVEGTALYNSLIVKLAAANTNNNLRRLLLQPTIITGQSLQLSSDLSSATDAQAVLVDNIGRILWRQTIQLPAGNAVQRLPLKQPLAAGVYYLQVYNVAQGWKEVLTAIKQ